MTRPTTISEARAMGWRFVGEYGNAGGVTGSGEIWASPENAVEVMAAYDAVGDADQSADAADAVWAAGGVWLS